MSTSAGVYEDLLPACSPEFRISFYATINKLWRYFHPHHECFFRQRGFVKNKQICVRQYHGASI